MSVILSWGGLVGNQARTDLLDCANLLAVTTAALLAGLIVRRAGSLWLPIVVHICFDVPLYYAAVCRLP